MDLREELAWLEPKDGVVFINSDTLTRPVLNDLMAAIFDNYDVTAIWTQTGAPSKIEAALRAVLLPRHLWTTDLFWS